MVEEFIPPDVRGFLLERIQSVAELEALLLLHQHRSETWNVTRIANRLYVAEPAAMEILNRLIAERLCAADASGFRFAPADLTEATLISQLADTYARHLIPITRIIHSKPARIQKFADAFLFRNDKKDK